VHIHVHVRTDVYTVPGTYGESLGTYMVR